MTLLLLSKRITSHGSHKCHHCRRALPTFVHSNNTNNTNASYQRPIRRGMAVYALGHGWTGALGTGRYDDHIKGHDDEDTPDKPVLVYGGDVLSADAGWGHTAIVTNDYYQDNNPDDDSNNSKNNHYFDHRLLMCGRPHDLQAILRLNRFPPIFRKHIIQWTHSAHHQNYDTTGTAEYAYNPTALASRFIQWALNERGTDADKTLRLWELAKQYSIMSELEEVEMPNYDAAGTVVASAGLTAIIGQSGGTLYTMGLNNRGQCGVGYASNNVWVPQQVMGLSEDFAAAGREFLYQAYPIQQVALGLQHGYAVCTQGNLYSWGKGDRAQLGQDASAFDLEIGSDGSTSEYGRHIRKAFELDDQERPDYFFLPSIQQVASGFHHGAALTTDTNQVFIWGKNVLRPLEFDRRKRKVASDCKSPTPLKGLPPNLKILRIACGSHHTAILMEDGSVYAVGICTDEAKEIIFDPVCVVPAGIIDMPCRQFDAHFDRTTIVGKDGTQVLQFHLWNDPELREYGVFAPFWVDHLLEEDLRIRSIHRGWLHTVVVTDEDDMIEGHGDQRRIQERDEKLLKD